jgi:cobalamin biosynthesis Mg chelatase CobN
MAEPARRHAPTEEAPEYDPRAIERTLLEQRRRREARVARQRAHRNARIRFFVVIVALLAATIALGVLVWHQIQRLFGL